MNKENLVWFLSMVFLFISSLILFEYINPHMVAKDKIYRRVDNPKDFKFECFWDFSTSYYPSRVCTYEPIKEELK